MLLSPSQVGGAGRGQRNAAVAFLTVRQRCGLAGAHRCGKSYLINRLMRTLPGAEVADTASGFSVGHTVTACTQGVWMCDTALVVKRPDGSRCRLLLVDSEGSGDTGQVRATACCCCAPWQSAWLMR